MNKLHISLDARTDLDEIKDYISKDLENPIAARDLIVRITKDIRILERFAQAGPLLSSIIDIQTDYRYLTVGNYMVFYRTLGEDVYIDRVLYGKSNYLRTLLDDKDNSSVQ